METVNSWIESKVAIITGGGSGIGRAIAIEAAGRGAIVIVVDKDLEKAENTVREIEKKGFVGYAKCTDVTNEPAIKEMIDFAREKGPIRYLANSAGCQTYGTAETTSLEDWDVTMDVNLKSMFLVIRNTLPEIRKNGEGAIVNISSIQGLRCQKNVLAYATAKGAVIAMTRSMGLDHAPEGIRINCICPGSVDTPMLRYGAGQHGPLEEVLEKWGSHHPIGRIGTAEEIAKTTLFLWHPDAAFIVGQAIIADGGLGSVIL